MSVGVIIPVIRPKLVRKILKDVANQTNPPEQIILVDNSKEKIYNVSPELIQNKIPTTLYIPQRPIGVNEAWKFGFNSLTTKYIAVLNDDARICKNYFNYAQRIFGKYRKVVVTCPAMKDTTDTVYGIRDMPNLDSIFKREGWAFIIRKSFIQSVPPIPNELKMYYGDDWYWYWAQEKEMEWTKIKNAYCVHIPHNNKKGSSLLKNTRMRERIVFYSIIGEKIP